MSVQQNHYMIIGAKFDYDEFYKAMLPDSDDPANDFDEAESPYQDSAFEGIHMHNGLCVISDGMNGEYVYIGHVMKKSDDYGSLDDYVFRGKAPSAKRVSKMIEEQFGLDGVKCSTHCFTHYR